MKTEQPALAAALDPLAGRRILVGISGSIAAVKLPLVVSALAQRGADVAVHYSSSKREAAETVAAIIAVGRKAVALQADLLDETAVTGLVARAAAALNGPLTVLVNNASIFEYDTVQTATKRSWDRAMGSNLRAPFLLAARTL